MASESSTLAKPLSRTDRVLLIKKHHQPLLDTLGIPNAMFGCKSVCERSGTGYELPIGKIGFFESEVSKTDFYFEITTFTPEVKDPNRQLYLLKYDPSFSTNTVKYQLVEHTPTNNPMYFVDPKDFVKVNWPIAMLETELSLEADKEDIPKDQLTARDYACIHLRVPDSNVPWINKLINKANEQ